MTPPVFGHGHLRLYILSLLAERPQHGYELIQSLEQRFGGTYTPSAGTIYPRLAKLEEDGLVTKIADGRKTVYEITDAGRAELASREGELDGIEDELTDSVRRLADEVRNSVNAAMKTLRADLASAARDARSETRASTTSTATTEGTEGTESAEAPETAAGESGPSGVKTTALGAREALRDAEFALTEFRHEVRTELRGRTARGELTAETVADLRSRLDEVRRTL
ncbi:PadR family transcriptional regulator [Salinibacterium sp. ZJ454]|uniref:PadR family transcriptional regulator n=1 Tax=Salinibacterium sp. ZJ454 TaxID=2708339 RepID=UPI00141E7593|nr:PadR family transcriptional regulator [Salinibacterium sp. ZJ454]